MDAVYPSLPIDVYQIDEDSSVRLFHLSSRHATRVGTHICPAHKLHAVHAVKILDYMAACGHCALLLFPRPGVDHRVEQVCLAVARVEGLRATDVNNGNTTCLAGLCTYQLSGSPQTQT